MSSTPDARLDYLISAQNPDGGWPYLTGKASWLEPTAWAMLALAREPGSAAWQKGWNFVRSLQREDGAWRASPVVRDAHWTTALAITLHTVRASYDQAFEKGIAWLLQTAGMENRWLARTMHALNPTENEMDYSLPGWPWRPDNSSWVEPTAHTLVALRKASGRIRSEKLLERVQTGEKMLLDRRCVDGGWNYGNRRVLQANLDSYPETTAIALVGLQNHGTELETSRRLARRYRAETRSRLAKAWLTLALRLHGERIDDLAAQPPSNDILITALEALGDAPEVLRMETRA